MKNNVRTNLIVVFVMVIVIIMIFFFMFLIQTQQKKAFDAKANEFGLIVTEHASNTIEEWVDDQVTICHIIGNNGLIHDLMLNPNDITLQNNAYEYLSHANEKFISINDFHINLFSEDSFELISHGRKMTIESGGIILDSNNGRHVGFGNIEDDYVRKIWYGYNYYISHLEMEMANANDVIMISVPIMIEDRLIGIASATYKPTEIYKSTIGDIKISDASDLAFVDRDGNVMGSKDFTGINAFEEGGDFATIAKLVQKERNHFHAMLFGEHLHFNAKPVVLLSDAMYASWYVIFLQSYSEINESNSALSNTLIIISVIIAICFGLIANVLIKSSHKKAQKEGLLLAQNELNRQIKNRTNSLEDLSVRDSLTGAYNHKTIIDFLGEKLKIDNNVSMIMLDLDLFKQVNDTYGHLTGDEVLAKISETIDQTIDDSHKFGRYGGEEFLIILPVTSLQSAIVLGEKIRKKIAGLRFSEVDLHITASLGIVHCNDELVKDNIKRVDDLLYRAKENGRNRIEWEVTS